MIDDDVKSPMQINTTIILFVKELEYLPDNWIIRSQDYCGKSLDFEKLYEEKF